MKEKFALTPVPDFIIATTVLGHGVNLPLIKRVFFLYPVKNPDFWLQMVARGGRRGESYSVFALENPIGIRFSRFKNFTTILWLTMKELFSFEALLRTLSRIKMGP
jgi:superfamily II DNA or RNA helicase